MIVDFAPPTYGRGWSSVLIDLRNKTQALVGIIDGVGSWGAGREAAEWTRQRLIECWREIPTFNTAQIVSDILQASATIPAELQDAEFDHSFSVTVALVDQKFVRVIAAGYFAVGIFSERPTQVLFKPQMLVDGMLRIGTLTLDQAKLHSMRNICVGPFIPLPTNGQLTVTQPYELPMNSTLIIASAPHMSYLLALPSSELLGLSASALQDLGKQHDRMPYPVVAVRSDGTPC